MSKNTTFRIKRDKLPVVASWSACSAYDISREWLENAIFAVDKRVGDAIQCKCLTPHSPDLDVHGWCFPLGYLEPTGITVESTRFSNELGI
jgi:hypothetical protein